MTELEFDPMDEMPPSGEVKGPRRGAWAAVALIALSVTLGFWLFLRSNRQVGTPAAATPAADSARAPSPSSLVAAPTSGSPPLDPGLPDLARSDPFVRALAAQLFSSPELDKWLAAGEDLMQQGVRALLAIAEQRSARRFVAFLPVEGPFATSGLGNRRFIAPESYRRYDRLVDLFVGLDSERLARFVERLGPLLSQTMDENAFPGTEFETTLKDAIGHLLATPLPAGEFEVVPGEDGLYRFADPRLEALSAPQKQLLRLGPRNGTRVRAKLADMEQALGQSHP